jgi:AcrR family transcriptional regulator
MLNKLTETLCKKKVSIVLRPLMKERLPEERILTESGSMFFKHGIRSITMDDIAHKLGISKKTIYQHYPDKKTLVRSFTNQELQWQENEMFEIRKVSKDPIDEMVNVMGHLGNFFGSVNPAVFYDLQKFHPDAWRAFRAFKERVLIGFVEENLKKGIASQLYRKELNITLLARLRIEEVEMGFNASIYPPSKFSLSDVQLAFIDHFIHGIVTLKGYKLIEKYKNKNFKKVS